MKNKQLFFTILFVLFGLASWAQQDSLPYNPNADAQAELKAAIAQAKLQKKHVLAVVGGNWCPWCRLFNGYIHQNAEISKLLNENYVLLKVNYSKENKNLDVLKQLEFPQRFGFPVIVVLDADGKRIHTQNSAFLEQGRGYNDKIVAEFLKAWSAAALDPKLYEK